MKCRLGVDNSSYADLVHFVKTVSESGVSKFIVHARQAILGLNTKDNRTVPPIDYDQVKALKAQFPHLQFVVNGAISSID